MARYANTSQYTILIGAYKGAKLPLGDFEMLKMLLDLSEGLGWISGVEIFGKDLVAVESEGPYFATLATYFCPTLNEWWWYFPGATYEKPLNNNG